MTFKDTAGISDGTYRNTDVAISTGRVFFWHRHAYKRFDCQALLCWCTCWLGCLNKFVAARNLHNSSSFFTLPALLSFSTDLSVDPPSWCVPHHQPLKCPLWEGICMWLTHKVTCDGRHTERRRGGMWGCCKRTAPSANISLLWRLKQSAHADDDFIIHYRMKPYSVEDAPDSDAEDIYLGLGFAPEQIDVEKGHMVFSEGEDKFDTLRVVMSVVQDQCHKLLDEVDVLY